MSIDISRTEKIKRLEQEAEQERSRYISELEFTIEANLKELALLIGIDGVREYIKGLEDRVAAF